MIAAWAVSHCIVDSYDPDDEAISTTSCTQAHSMRRDDGSTPDGRVPDDLTQLVADWQGLPEWARVAIRSIHDAVRGLK